MCCVELHQVFDQPGLLYIGSLSSRELPKGTDGAGEQCQAYQYDDRSTQGNPDRCPAKPAHKNKHRLGSAVCRRLHTGAGSAH